MSETLSLIVKSETMEQMWEQFRKKNFFVGDLVWADVITDVLHTIQTYIIEVC